MGRKIFAVNPGSTSTKIALFEDNKCIFSENVTHDAKELKAFPEIKDQMPYRMETIKQILAEKELTLDNTAAFVGRGGGLMPLEGGVYKINEKLLEHARACLTAKHPATLGSQISDALSREFGGIALVVNPPDVDEFDEIARITGLKGVYRESRVHALNQKEIGIRFADKNNKKYNEVNLIIAHLGGGVSITAHCKGKMIDSTDAINGEGPMAPTRSGSVPARRIIEMCYSEGLGKEDMLAKLVKTGGLVDHLNTADVLEIMGKIDAGDEYAKLILDAMLYQVSKSIGSMAAVLKGNVDGIILTGGISKSEYVTNFIKERTSFIAPVNVMAGEFEMEALAAGAVRVLDGIETAKDYTGIPVWTGDKKY
ncbi:MAG: butyrate kinase [Eubacteriales bacterium]